MECFKLSSLEWTKNRIAFTKKKLLNHFIHKGKNGLRGSFFGRKAIQSLQAGCEGRY